MDPTSILLSALGLASAALAPVANAAVKDGYAGLKAVIIRKATGKYPDIDNRLTNYERKPDVWREPVKDALQESGVSADQEILNRATELLKQAEAVQPGISGGLVGQINAQGGKVIVANTIHGGIQM
ncbi:MAG: hypothetical protein NVSMB2_10940 [Chloroflexota bacterium]